MTIKNQRPRRSFIFTPGLKPEMYPKALASGADIVCVELEDGIAPKDKAEARKNALALFEQPQADDGVEKMVRINFNYIMSFIKFLRIDIFNMKNFYDISSS